jgi:hypothetical protein
LDVRRFLLFTILLAAFGLFGSACVRRITVAETLPVNAEVSVEELVRRIDSYNDVKSFSAQVSVYVRNYFTGKEAKADEYPVANGALRLQRPENIRMLVTAPVINSDVADMVSDGQKFKLAIYYPSDKRQFVYGSNLKEFERMGADEIHGAKDQRLAQAGGLLNMRPQHITDAFLIKANPSGERTVLFREEVRQEERDDRPGKKNRMVLRAYYVLYVLERDDAGQAKLLRKFWFDRTQRDTRLARQQIFEDGGGKLASDITYSSWFKVPDNNMEWPARVVVDRRSDGYRIELQIERETAEINAELPSTTFVLENTKNLKELNLDEPRKASAAQGRRPEPIPPVR